MSWFSTIWNDLMLWLAYRRGASDQAAKDRKEAAAAAEQETARVTDAIAHADVPVDRHDTIDRLRRAGL